MIHHGDCLEILAQLDDASVDAVVTDPPYGLEFMGKEWDRFGRNTGNHSHSERPRFTSDHMGKGFDKIPNTYEAGKPYQIWSTEWAIECLRVLKPGGHLLAFGGSRTWHRLTCAIEDAGFEIRDSIAWLYGSGFPKSLDVSKAIDKAAGAKREVVGVHHRHGGGSEVSGSMSGPLGTGSELPLTAPATDAAKQWQGWGTALKPAYEPIVVARKPLIGTVANNVLEHGTGALNIDACRVKADGGRPLRVGDYKQTDNAVWAGRMDGSLQGGSKAVGETTQGRWPTNVALDEHQAEELDSDTANLKAGGAIAPDSKGAGPRKNEVYGKDDKDRGDWQPYGDSGGASRFFPVFKYQAKAPSRERPKVEGVAHPTVKPLSLMRWLVKLVTPPNGIVLDPFAGSGTTVEACVLENFRYIAIEREAAYLPLIMQRLERTETPCQKPH